MALREGLRDLGYVEGENLLIDQRNVNGDDQLSEPAADLVRLKPEVVVVPSSTVARAAQAASATIPIVSLGAGDLIASGLAASYGKPGGNVTGMSTPPLAGKHVQLLRETIPRLERVAVLVDATVPNFAREPYEAAGRSLNAQVQFVEVAWEDDLEPRFESMVRDRADGLLVPTGPVFTANQTLISELAVRRRLPTLWLGSEAVSRGGLMAYGPNRADLARRAATHVDKILKGSKAADLPIEQPTRFDFAINLNTARALGLTIPPSVLQQATETIQ